MPAQIMTEEVKKRSAWSILMGRSDLGPGIVSDCLSAGGRDDYKCLPGLDPDFRRHCLVCLRASFANGWQILLEEVLSSLLYRKVSSSVWATGTLVGASVVMSGIFRIMIASKTSRGAAVVERLARTA
jgi:hypothetical protein